MTDHFEQTLVGSLDRRAASPVDTIELATAAARRGRTLRRRRYALACAGVVAVAIAGAVGVTTLSPAAGSGQFVGGPAPVETSTDQPSDDSPPPPPGGWAVPALPVASGVPGAAGNPALVGADPGTLHFSVDGLISGAESATWAAGSGSESVQFVVGGKHVEVDLARDVARLDALVQRHRVEPAVTGSQPETRNAKVGELPATLYVYRSGQDEDFYLRWQPLRGVWAQVYGYGDLGRTSDPTEVAAKVRFDTAYRCVAPVRLTALPRNAKLLNCKVVLAGADLPDSKGAPTRLGEAILTVGVGVDQAEVAVRRRMAHVLAPEMSLGGHPAWKTKNERGDWLVVVSDFDGVRIELAGSGKYGYPELTIIGDGIKVDGDLRKPATWPTKLTDS